MSIKSKAESNVPAQNLEDPRQYFMSRLNDYKTKTKFTPFCFGIFGMSGLVGKMRAKRAGHLFKNAKTADGVDFVAYILFNIESAKTLKSFLKGKIFDDSVSAANSKIRSLGLEKNSQFFLVVEVFTDFFNVLNYPSAKFKNQFNSIMEKFTFDNLRDKNSMLNKEIRQLKSDMAEVLMGQVAQTRSLK